MSAITAGPKEMLGDEVPVHHIQMQQIRSPFFDAGNRFGQVGKVRSKQ